MLILCAQCITWNRDLPHFSSLHKDGFLNSLWIEGPEFGKMNVNEFFSLASWICNNSRPLEAVIGDVREGKFYWLPPEYEETVLHPPSIREMPKPISVFCDYVD